MKRWMVLFLAAGAILSAQITPSVTCVSYDSSGNQLTVFFGYDNISPSVIAIPFGSSNFVSPQPGDRGQTTQFLSGTVSNAWSTLVDLTVDTEVSWIVLGNAATATNNPSQYCAFGLTACWDTNGNGVCDLATEDINGDGVCNALDCQGRVGVTGPTGPAGAQGPAGSQGPAGPPGISPAIVSVTVPSTTATATASCTTPQVVLNGGGMCAVPNTNTISGRIASSAPSGSNGWTVTCSTGNATAVALCALPGGSQ